MAEFYQRCFGQELPGIGCQRRAELKAFTPRSPGAGKKESGRFETMNSTVVLESPAQEKAPREAADIVAVKQLILRERSSRDLGLWEQMRDCFHEDSTVRLSWIDASGPEFVRRSQEMAERNVKATHRLGPILVTLAGDRAIAQLGAIIDIPGKVRSVAVVVSTHARFVFRTERRSDVWRISASMRSISATRLIRSSPAKWSPSTKRAKELSSVLSALEFLFDVGRLQAAYGPCRYDRPDWWVR